MFATTHPANTSQALSLVQALKADTVGSAAAEHAESEKGTVAQGKLADLAMLSQDIFDVPAEALPRTVSVLTVVDGTVAHETLPPDTPREIVGSDPGGERVRPTAVQSRRRT
jgi:predicted amidohydrolase YtcJ